MNERKDSLVDIDGELKNLRENYPRQVWDAQAAIDELARIVKPDSTEDIALIEGSGAGIILEKYREANVDKQELKAFARAYQLLCALQISAVVQGIDGDSNRKN